MEIALGVLKWTPATFWAATPHELYPAIDGHLESIGARKGPTAEPMTSDRLAELMKRFPD